MCLKLLTLMRLPYTIMGGAAAFVYSDDHDLILISEKHQDFKSSRLDGIQDNAA